MLFETSSIFQRTERGRDEIHHKSHGLTQSERRVLITTDGVTAYADLLTKMSSLTESRIERAISTLLDRNLVYEVLMPVAGQKAEEIDKAVVDRFLQQDPLDPKTIIALDPDDDFSEIESLLQQGVPELKAAIENRKPASKPGAQEAETADVAPAAPMRATVTGPEQGRSEKVVLSPKKPEVSPKPVPVMSPSTSMRQRKQASPTPIASAVVNQSALNRPHWGFWLVSAGLCVLGISVAFRLIG